MDCPDENAFGQCVRQIRNHTEKVHMDSHRDGFAGSDGDGGWWEAQQSTVSRGLSSLNLTTIKVELGDDSVSKWSVGAQ